MHALISRFRIAAALLVVAGALATTPALLSAQYFGRNKVQYRTFHFRVMKTEHFDIYFYPEEEAAARDVGRMAERWYARLSRLLNHEFESRQPLVLYANAAEFQQTNILGAVGEGTGGVTESAKQRIIMPITGSYAETDHVLGHELVHAFQYDISGLGRSRGSISAGARAVGTAPLWLIEGMAEYLSLGPIDVLTAMWLRDAAVSGKIPSIEQLSTDPRIFPYRFGHAVWAYVGGRWGDAAVGQILTLIGQGVPYEEAFQRITNSSLDEISESWQTAIRRAYLPLLAERPEANEIARPLITNKRRGGSLNVSPALSPDGKYVAFLSERELDIDLWLADTETGEVVRRLQKGSAFDPHYSSLNFISSAGSFSPDGTRFALTAQKGGEDVIAIIDVARARRVQEIEARGLGDITNPTWSPDGRTIVFSATRGGISDLYAVDVATRQLRQLTNDLYADMQPVFSPDGRTIAFTSDRGPHTNLDSLSYGGYRLALLDVESGRVRAVPNLPWDGRNPAWSRDGSALYFISNRTGIANIYRVNVSSGETAQITHLFGGVSGITQLSPALAVARNADLLVFNSYEGGNYNLYALNEAKALAGTPLPVEKVAVADTVAPLAALLPPVPRPKEPAYNRVAQLLENPSFGLEPKSMDTAFAVVRYSPRISLDYLGQPQVGVSTGSAFGRGGVYGGIAAVFSDVLANHTLYGAVQANGQLDEIGFATIYLNQRQRWNFGAAAQRVPYVYGFYNVGCDVNNPSDCRQQIIRARFFDTSLQGLAQYPFSTVQRVEFSAGLRRFAQDAQILEQQLDPATGFPISDWHQRNEDGSAFNMVEGSAALVYDNSLTSYTSPFAGQRYRFEVSPAIGNVTFVQALADFRKYFYMRPLTFAVRGLQYGRYGKNAEDERLFPALYLGYPSLVRGYYNVYGSCIDNGGLDCTVLNQLQGSRIAVANAELRFPFIRQLVLGPGIGFPPIEGFVFGDAGIAWNRSTTPVFRRGIPLDQDGFADVNRHGIVTSAGIGMRVNLFGYFIAEVDYLRAFERDNGWRWQFALQPGF